MHRVLISPTSIHAGTIHLRDAPTLHHLLDVLRVQVGDRLECFDGQGHVYLGTVTAHSRQQLVVAVEQRADAPVAGVSITLAQSLIQPSRFEWVLQKATELGVARMIPLITTRTTIRCAPGDSPLRLTRWRRIVEAAATQCGRITLPTLETPQSFTDVLTSLVHRPAVLFTLAPQAIPLEKAMSRLPSMTELTVLIGPEGDFSKEEVAAADAAGVPLARLGALTLRAETAGLAVLAILQHRLGAL